MTATTPALHSAREQLDCAVAALLEAATAAIEHDELTRKAVAQGQQMERDRVRRLLQVHIDSLPRYSSGRRELLVVLAEVSQ
jgi:hypothetical protein